VLFVAFFGLYAALGLRLAQGNFLDYWNLAFDFDPSRFVRALAGHPPDGGGFKHPLVLLFRPIGLGFSALGFSAKSAASLVMALFGAGTVVVVFAFCRGAGLSRPEAGALSLLYGVSSTQLFTAFIAESYGLSLFALALTWTLLQRALRSEPRLLLRWRVALAVAVAGITITNVLQNFVGELWLRLRSAAPYDALRGMFRFGVAFGLTFVILAVAIWHRELIGHLADPIQALKTVYWLRTKGEAISLGQVLVTFFGYTVVAPQFTAVDLGSGILMKDFRAFRFEAYSAFALWAWLGLLSVGTLLGLAHSRFRRIAIPMVVALAINVLFHLDYQFRGSVYIYCAHLHFLVFALPLGLACWLPHLPRWCRPAYVAGVLALAALAGTANITRAIELATAFDGVDYGDAPEVKG